MKQKELKKKINEFMSMLSNNGYSSHVIVVKNKNLESIGASGDMEDIVYGFVQMFSDAANGDAPEALKMTCSAIADIVRQYQRVAYDSLLGLTDDDGEDCEHCDKLHECMNPSAVERRKKMGVIIGGSDVN